MKHVLLIALWGGLYLLVTEILYVLSCDQEGLAAVKDTCSGVAKHSFESIVVYVAVTGPALLVLSGIFRAVNRFKGIRSKRAS